MWVCHVCLCTSVIFFNFSELPVTVGELYVVRFAQPFSTINIKV